MQRPFGGGIVVEAEQIAGAAGRGLGGGNRIVAPAEDIDEALTKKLKDTALADYRALKLRDYGRVDMRLNKKGEVYVIEANPNPWLASAAEFTMAAKKAGYSYTDMIRKIVELALARSL